MILGLVRFASLSRQQCHARPAGDAVGIVGGDPLDLRAMSGLAIPRIAEDHSVLVERVSIARGSAFMHWSFAPSLPKAQSCARSGPIQGVSP